MFCWKKNKQKQTSDGKFLVDGFDGNYIQRKLKVAKISVKLLIRFNQKITIS